MKKNYSVIGLTGAAGSGKDTVADILCEVHGFVKLGFADPLYEMMSIVTRTPVEVLKKRDNKEVYMKNVGASPRRLGQTLGTEWGRDMISEDIWIAHLHGRLTDIEVNTWLRGLVISDVRFPNEVDYVHRLGGEVWRVERPDNTSATTTTGHSSEKFDFDADDIIVNDGALDDLRRAVLLKYVDYLGV